MTAEITELVPVRRLVGYDYNPITKLVEPRYEYDTQRKPLRTLALTTRSGGAFGLTLTVPAADHDYDVVLRTKDGAGRTAQRTIVASRAVTAEPDRLPVFENTGAAGGKDLVYRIGEPIRLTMTDRVRPLPTGRADRYLYIVSQQGLRSATVTTSPRFSRTFAAADAPGIFIIGVHFTGRTYAPKSRRLGHVRHPAAEPHRRASERPAELPARRHGDGDRQDEGRERATHTRHRDPAGRR